MSAEGVRIRAKSATDSRGRLSVFWLLAAFVLTWTIYPALTRINLDPYGDMLENYAWGIGWQWGYFKHPPFFAWTAAAWFELFPRADWAYYLLSAVNAALAVFVSWRIALRFLDPWRSLLASCLFFFLPPVTFLATKFNANSALLPIWPLIVLFYLRFLERRRLVDALVLGLVAAIGILTKYFTAVLLASIVLHILFDRDARSLLRSASTWLAAAVFLLALVPHLIWLWNVDFQTISYAASQGDGRALDGVTSGLRFVVALVLYLIPAVLILYLTLLRNRGEGKTAALLDASGFRSLFHTVEGRALAWTTFGSVAVTLAIAVLLGTRLSSVWGLPMYFAVPVFVLAPVRPGALEVRREVIPTIIAVYVVALLVAAPFVRYFDEGREKHYSHVPVAGIAQAVEEAWKHETAAPLVYVGGDKILSSGTSFYAPARPYAVIENSLDNTPWITPDDLRRSGIVVACLANQKDCEAALAIYPVEFSKTETLSVQDITGKPWNVVIHLALPEQG